MVIFTILPIFWISNYKDFDISKGIRKFTPCLINIAEWKLFLITYFMLCYKCNEEIVPFRPFLFKGLVIGFWSSRRSTSCFSEWASSFSIIAVFHFLVTSQLLIDKRWGFLLVVIHFWIFKSFFNFDGFNRIIFLH